MIRGIKSEYDYVTVSNELRVDSIRVLSYDLHHIRRLDHLLWFVLS
jgi:hypothetical protein